MADILDAAPPTKMDAISAPVPRKPDILDSAPTPVAKAVTTAQKTATNAAGSGLLNVLRAPAGALEALRAPQRALAGFGQYVEDNNLGNGAVFTHPGALGAALRQGGKWGGDAKRDDAADKYDRRRLSTADGGFLPTDEQINAHLRGAPATAARWGAQTASSVLADPTTFIPAGGIAKVVRSVPGMAQTAEAISKSGLGRQASALFNSEHHLKGLTEHGKNVVAGIQNVATQTAERAKRDDDLIISTARNDLKAGIIPPSVAALVQKYGLDPLKGPQKPSDVLHLIEEARHAAVTKTVTDRLRGLDLIKGRTVPAGVRILPKAGLRPADLFKNPTLADDAREGVAEHIKPTIAPDGPVGKLIAKTNTQLKGLFLAVPIPHVANLVNLSYNKYGMGVTLRGLMYAVQESTGLRRVHLNNLVTELQKAGSDNQYGKIFSEVNPIAPIRQVQRFANAAQDKILNPVERGLRASMMENELRAGKTGVDAARNLHRALGTDASTGMTKFLNRMPGAQFPRFHTQTAMGSTLRTIGDKPGRITGFEHAFGGPTQPKDGQPHYHLITPTASGVKMLDNPLGYLSGSSTLGGFVGTGSPFSIVGLLNRAISETKKGQGTAAKRDAAKAVESITGRIVPLSGSIAALSEILRQSRGQQLETGQEDLASSLGGGYWSKQ